MRSSFIARLRRRARAWSLRRHGHDGDPVVLSGRHIYIVPTRLGIAFACMIFAMFLGAMNYANNLALGLTFTLASMGLTAMHYCHRTIAGLRLSSALCEPVFAGQLARFRIAVENLSPVTRYEILMANDHSLAAPIRLEPNERAVMELDLPAPQRGRLPLEFFEVRSGHPFGLFRAWAFMHMPMSCIVYPRPSERALPPPPLETDTGGALDSLRGDEDFAGLRTFVPGDSPRRIAWKTYARGLDLQVKVYAGTAVTSHQFDWNTLEGMGVEARLSQLCRWVEDAHRNARAYGLRLPGVEIAPNIGMAHRQRCLTALALFDAGAGHG